MYKIGLWGIRSLWALYYCWL